MRSAHEQARSVATAHQTVPATLSDLINARLDRLGRDTRSRPDTPPWSAPEFDPATLTAVADSTSRMPCGISPIWSARGSSSR